MYFIILFFFDYSFSYMLISEIDFQFIYSRKKNIYTHASVVNYAKISKQFYTPPLHICTQKTIHKEGFLNQIIQWHYYIFLKLQFTFEKYPWITFFINIFSDIVYREIHSLDFIYVFSPAYLFPVCLFSFGSQSMNYALLIYYFLHLLKEIFKIYLFSSFIKIFSLYL